MRQTKTANHANTPDATWIIAVPAASGSCSFLPVATRGTAVAATTSATIVAETAGETAFSPVPALLTTTVPAILSCIILRRPSTKIHPVQKSRQPAPTAAPKTTPSSDALVVSAT